MHGETIMDFSSQPFSWRDFWSSGHGQKCTGLLPRFRVQQSCRGCGGNHPEGVQQSSSDRQNFFALLLTKLDLDPDHTCLHDDGDDG